jgi:hypothetical protein
MKNLYIICGGCRHFIAESNICKRQFELFPDAIIPDSIAGRITKMKFLTVGNRANDYVNYF